VKFEQVFLPAKILLGEKWMWLIWGGIALGGIAVARGRFTPRERSIFIALPIIIIGSAAIAWLVQTQSDRGYVTRYLIGHVVVLIPAGLFYWARVGTLGSVAFWRGLHTGRIYAVNARIVGAAGLVLVGWAWIAQLEDVDGWVRSTLTPHGDARALIEEHLQKGDLVVAGSGFEAEGFQYNCDGHFEVLITPHLNREASTRGRVQVEHAEVERKTAAVERRVTDRLRAGGRVWYYFPVSARMFPVPEEGKRRHGIPTESLTEREKNLRTMHLRVLGSMEQHGNRTILESWTKGYRIQYRLALFCPRAE
jgi:hypothetical protein